MATLVAGMASSHAYALVDPSDWERMRARSRRLFEERHGFAPRENPLLPTESEADNEIRYAKFRNGLENLKSTLAELSPDVLILIGDDQNENFAETIPQFALYGGDEVVFRTRSGEEATQPCDAKMSRILLEHLVNDGFDVTFSPSFPNQRLISHAHAQILSFLQPSMPVVLLFVNAVHYPAPSPARCFSLGRAIRDSLEQSAGDEQVVMYASGGLSHFSPDYPFEQVVSDRTVGSICVEFDHQLVAAMQAGRGESLTTLTTGDLTENGAIEFRQWMTLLGAVAESKPSWFVYEPFYHGIMGMGVGYWSMTDELSSLSSSAS